MRTLVLSVNPKQLFPGVLFKPARAGEASGFWLLVPCKWLPRLQYREPKGITAPIAFCSGVAPACSAKKNKPSVTVFLTLSEALSRETQPRVQS